jgi:hypothetical protein
MTTHRRSRCSSAVGGSSISAAVVGFFVAEDAVQGRDQRTVRAVCNVGLQRCAQQSPQLLGLIGVLFPFRGTSARAQVAVAPTKACENRVREHNLPQSRHGPLPLLGHHSHHVPSYSDGPGTTPRPTSTSASRFVQPPSR